MLSNGTGFGDVKVMLRNVEKLALSLVLVHNLFMGYSRLGSLPATMTAGSMDSFRQVVRNMLAALRMSDVGDDELHDLILHIGHTSKL